MALRASLATRGDAILCDLAAVNPRLLLQRSGRSVRIVQVTPVRCNFYSVRQVSTSGRSVRSALSRTLFRRSRWRCQACGRGGALEVHHILKRAQGGSDYRRRHSIPSIEHFGRPGSVSCSRHRGYPRIHTDPEHKK